MRSDPPLDLRTDLAIAAFLILGLGLAIVAGATGLHWLSAKWSPACQRLLRPPNPPSFAAPWRVADLRLETPCLRPRP